MNKTRFVCMLMLLVSSALEAAVIDVGVHNIAANVVTSIPISIRSQEGSDPHVAGMNIAIQIGDGSSGPVIKSVNLDSDTIFDGNNTGSTNQGSLDRQAFWGITTAAGSIPITDGLIATIEVDAAGLTEGSFALTLSSVLGAPTELLDTSASPIGLMVVDGQINIVPEPGTTGILGLAIAGFIAFSRRCHRASN